MDGGPILIGGSHPDEGTVRVPRYEVGQLVYHKRFQYRGVIIQVDRTFEGSDDWYDDVAKTKPPKDRPWYRVLVNNENYETYVAERHLEADWSNKPVKHPWISIYFDEFHGSHYVRTRLDN